jgi:hypothetical protein
MPRATMRKLLDNTTAQKRLTLNQRVQGSNPCAPTTSIKDLDAIGFGQKSNR